MALRIHAWLTTYAEDVLTALTRTGHHAEAVVYADLWADWAQGTAYRSNDEWCTELGLTLKQLRRRLATLGELGLVQVQVTAEGRQVQLQVPAGAVLPAELAGWCPGSGGDKKGTGGDKKGTLGTKKGTPFRVPTEIVENSLSACYISICLNGTVLALTTYAAYSSLTAYAALGSLNNAEYVGSILVPSVADLSGPTPPARRSRTKKVKGTGPTEAAGGGKPRKIPQASHEYRKAPMTVAAEDVHFPVIEALHGEWCDRLGKQFALNPWRYAAWRQALVEAGYTPEQLRAALPGVAEDPWWSANAADPHVMFGSNPSKIERFFPQNRQTVPDRFGRGVQGTTETFAF